MKKLISPRPADRSGFALIIVLAMLVLLVVLIVGILMRVTTERTAAHEYQTTISARQLADVAVSLVQGQINIATTQGSTVAWTSQPGMVRTFDTSGNLVNAYKLYSSSAMISNSAGINASGVSADVAPAGWASSPAVWTDLNAPVEINSVKNYPILDPSATADGYSITAAPGVAAGSYQQAPMPVQWLYELSDGTLIVPDTSSSTTATFANATAQPSTTNPIVGRIAFWTDDDSCKVNINTASEGTYWDTPRAASNGSGPTFEETMANFQPAQHEWQRYPGHPSMTSLSTVFPGLTAAQIYKIIPRIVGGGSTGGTVIATTPLTADTDRLYANVDELVFNPARAQNPDTTSPLTKAQVEQAKFFLTAKSRAPETTLSNLPRIACWPIYNGMVAAKTSAFDQLIAFCSSTGPSGSVLPYYFQRQAANSSTTDIAIARNKQLYSYLQYLTGQSIPGYGGNFLTKYGNDRDQILTEIFDYIRSANLSDDTLLAANRYTASAPGWVIGTQYNPSGSNATMGFGRTYTLSELGIGFICNADGADTTLGSNDPTKNMVLGGTFTAGNSGLTGGTALTSTQKCIQAIMIPEFFSPSQGWVAAAPNFSIKMKGLANLTLNSGATLFPNLDSSLAGIAGVNSYGFVFWGAGPSWKWFGINKVAPAAGNLAADTVTAGTSVYPYISNPVVVTGSTMTFNGGDVTLEIYGNSTATGTPLQSLVVNLPAATFPVPNLVKTRPKVDTTSTTVPQNWWSFSVRGEMAAVSGTTETFPYPGRLNYIGNNPNAGGSFLNGKYQTDPDTDVIKTVLPSHGDYRLVAASPSLATGQIFAQHPTYSSSTTFASNDLASWDGTDSGNPNGYDHGGKYVSALTYPAWLAPDIPSNATQLPGATGDYDNGVSITQDGPYINKPDEGNSLGLGTKVPYFDTNWQSALGGSIYFSPNRQIPSAGMFGSLPTGVKAGVPWRTLLFRPQPTHFGAGSPEDELMLDLFWMPVVEPYAISDRFSTAGKINMNYQILPFTYITRSTGMRALLKAERVGAIPNTDINLYKPTSHNTTWIPSSTQYRLPIDIPTTLSQFDTKFIAGNVFKSAAEICDMHIVPTGQTVASMGSTFWTNYALTGDNLRERIYTTLYPRLTTKSNTFTVHFRVQTLKKAAAVTAATTWVEGTDAITGEYRGSTTLERFINASTTIPDYAAHAAATPATISSDATLDTFYKWRVVENRQFAP